MSAIFAIMDEINTEHNMKSICRPAVAQWTERLTRKGQTRVRNWKGANILLSHWRRGYRAEAGNQQSSSELSQTRIAMRTLPLNKGGGNVVSAICAIMDEINTEHIQFETGKAQIFFYHTSLEIQAASVVCFYNKIRVH